MKKLIFICCLLPLFAVAQHQLSGSFSPAEDFKAAILYKIEITNSVYINHANIENGVFELTLPPNAKPGMYRIVYALPQNEYNFDFIFNNEDIQFTFNQDEGVSFLNSKENLLLTQYRGEMQKTKTAINSFYSDTNPNPSDYLNYITALKTTQNQFESKSKGTLAHHFIVSERPYIPNNYEDAATYFNNYKTHYFDAIDFSDPVLKNSNALLDAALNYVFIFVDKDQPNGSYKNNIDRVVEQLQNETALQKTILEILWSQFKDQQNNVVANYISSTYLLQLLDPETDKDFLNEIQAFKNTAIGVTAPNFSWPTPEGTKSLDQLSGNTFYIVTFWSSTCSHCLEELPVLKQYLSHKLKMQVIAIGLEDEPTHWQQTIKNYPDFTHIYGEGHWDNPISTMYGVTGTPSFFVLDASKKIVAKPDDVEELMSFLDLQHQ